MNKQKEKVARYKKRVTSTRLEILKLNESELLKSDSDNTRLNDLNLKIDFYIKKIETIEGCDFILSDSPDAIEKLTLKIQSLRYLSLFLQACNKNYKQTATLGTVKITPYWFNEAQLNISAHGVPFPERYFVNIRQNIRFASKRIAKLNKKNDFKPFKINEISVFIKDGQIKVHFPNKPIKKNRLVLADKPFLLRWSTFQAMWVRKFTGQGEKYFSALAEFLKTIEYEETKKMT